ncbi:TPA: prolyl oligopeptidase family serine peptidase [Escherichia coli]|nr:prolyl oligopeptidase family serine peptidase [Escherichia coli]EFH2906877.1 prolyl oligopeptidase family serine peptidase [Escherichia coli]EGQ2073674.1 prolyl oligopeptidase family serine peptidase [Escherichia coli]EHT7643977.1 prolyl oligopeptidase family serine peptidase [Escherichia coli]EIL3253207.1 prolyl oligopeptidase family serine peptidase [Escherichia coli]EIQ0364314.1 prolyl oligopeptidase family serine peptidase [Escherichia coli]
MNKKTTVILLLLIAMFGIGALTEKKTNLISYSKFLIKENIAWDDTENQQWGSEFKEVTISSSIDEEQQQAMFLRSPKKAPLIISLHTWSGDYKQFDPLSDKATEAKWNYIHPDFRGPNWTVDACLSPKAIADIDDAIDYAINNGNVDENNIFVVGVSGGGYATLGSYLKSKHNINTFMAWVPISDLSLWHKQSKDRGSSYANNIVACTGSDGKLDEASAKTRSPLQWDIPSNKNNIEIYAGINDGHTGSVPVSQSILFFNKLAKQYDPTKIVTAEEAIFILDRKLQPPMNSKNIEGRDIIFERKSGPASIHIFDGSHEMLSNYAFDRLNNLIK